jgi:hypothetical protein
MLIGPAQGNVMRNVISICVLLVALPSAAAAQDGKDAPKGIKKGDKISVRGCLSGAALEATDVSGTDGSSPFAGGLTFRLTGDKSMLKELREKHDGKIVDVAGVLKSELTQNTAATRKVGKMHVTIGTPAAVPGRPDTETQRSLPVLELKSFNGGTTSCGR